ncbi:MAG TPA: DUF502 domain-containing protein [Flavobacteriaceae bacterium]|nr:DUF502 domain-containing protein [Flavobacteriaceae bacterium]
MDLKRLSKYFVNGLIYIVPIALTFYLLYEVFVFIDEILPFNLPPGFGLIIMLVLITLIGYLGTTLITDRIKNYLEKIIKRTPLINVIYGSIKDLITAFVGQKKSFSKPVMVKLYENSKISRVGFVTDEDLSELNIKDDLVAVYIPHSYNISGNLFLVPKSYVTPVDVKSAELMKYAVSGGVVRIGEEEGKQ